MQSRLRPHPVSSWLNVAAKLGGTALSFLLYVALARILAPEVFADVAVILAWIALASTIACFSFPLALVRFVPENIARGRADLARGAVQFSIAFTVAVAAAMAAASTAVLLAGVLPLPRDLPRSALFAAALLVPSVLLLDLAGLLTALKRAVVSELLLNIVRPTLLLGGLLVVWSRRDTPLAAHEVIGAYFIASILLVPVSLSYCIRALSKEVRGVRANYQVREWMRIAAGFMVAAIASAFYERIDLLVMGMTAPGEQIAAYAVASRFGQTVVVAASAAGAVMAPYLVEYLSGTDEARRGELRKLLRDTARTSLYVSLAAFCGFAIAGPLLLKLFGPAYERAYVPLVILAAGQVLSALFGPASGVATLAGAPRIAVAGMLAGAAIIACLNLALVPRFGATGAALATATGMCCASLLAWAWTRQRVGLDSSVFARTTPARD